MASLGDMVVRILGDVSDFDKKIGDAEKKMKSVGENMAKIGKGLTTYVTLPILGLGAAALKASSDMENLEASFTTMLGSADKAKALLADLTKLAAVTPFSTKDLAQASQTLLQFGVNAKDILPTIKNLGDVSGGNADRFKSLSLAFGQTASAGRLMGQDLLQMVNAGFNPLQEISKTTGISMADLKKQMEAGAISAEMVADSFKRASSEGGQFFGGMERGSKTLSGQVSTLLDELAQLGREFGEVLLPIAKDFIAGLTDMIRKFQSLTDEQKGFILTISLIAASIGPMILGFVNLAKAITAVDGAMKLLSGSEALMKAFSVGGPIALGIVAIGTAAAFAASEFKRGAAEARLFNNAFSGNASIRDIEKTIALQYQEIDNAKSIKMTSQAAYDAKVAGHRATIKELQLELNHLRAVNDAEELSLKQAALQAEADAKAAADAVKNVDLKISAITLEENAAEKLFQTYIDGFDELDARYENDDAEWAKLQGDKAQAARKAAEASFKAYQDAWKEGDELNEADLEYWLIVQEEKSKAAQQAAQDTQEAWLSALRQIASAAKPVFETMGAMLVDESIGWNDLATVAVNSIGNIISALGDELAARAAARTVEAIAALVSVIGAPLAPGLFASAAVLAGGAAAAWMAGGALKAVKLAEGGVVMPRAGGVPAILAEAGQPEVVFPLEKLERFLGGGSGGTPEGDIRLVVNLDSQPFLDKIFPATRNRTILISAGAVV